MKQHRNPPGIADYFGQAAGGIIGAIAGAAIGKTAGITGVVLGGFAGAIGGWWSGRAIAEAVEDHRHEPAKPPDGGDADQADAPS